MATPWPRINTASSGYIASPLPSGAATASAPASCSTSVPRATTFSKAKRKYGGQLKKCIWPDAFAPDRIPRSRPRSFLNRKHSRPQVLPDVGGCGSCEPCGTVNSLLLRRFGDRGHPGVPGEGVADGRQDGDAVLAGGVGVAANRVAVACGFLRAQPPGDLLLGLGRAQVPLGVVRRGWDAQVMHEPEHVVFPVAQAFQQVPAGRLLAAGHALDLADAEDDAVGVGVDQRPGDLAGDRVQALAAG